MDGVQLQAGKCMVELTGNVLKLSFD